MRTLENQPTCNMEQMINTFNFIPIKPVGDKLLCRHTKTSPHHVQRWWRTFGRIARRWNNGKSEFERTINMHARCYPAMGPINRIKEAVIKCLQQLFPGGCEETWSKQLLALLIKRQMTNWFALLWCEGHCACCRPSCIHTCRRALHSMSSEK